MTFENMHADNIQYVVKHTPVLDKWDCKNRKNHILGVKLDGNTVHRINNEEFDMSENCIYFLNQKDEYSARVIERGEAYSVHFTTYQPVETDSFCIKINDCREIIRLLDKIQIYSSIQGKEHKSLSYFYSLIATFEDILSKNYLKKDNRMTGARNYIDAHFKEDDCIEKAANEVGLSRRRFNDLFKNQFNITPNRYLTSRKIELSKELLKSGGFTLSEIADLCAFSDVYYFCKTFKKETGISPGKYKEKSK